MTIRKRLSVKKPGAERGIVAHSGVGRAIPLTIAGPTRAPEMPAPPAARIANARAQQQRQLDARIAAARGEQQQQLGNRIANARGDQQQQLAARIANARAQQQRQLTARVATARAQVGAQIERERRVTRLGPAFQMRERRAVRIADKRDNVWGLRINRPRDNTDPRTGRRLFERGFAQVPQRVPTAVRF